MKLYYLGTCAGTEPMPGRHHQSFALETDDGSVYWFDAGEACSYTAYLSGVDLFNVRAVFISHTHMDHVGGLGNLFWNIRKVTHVFQKPTRFNDIGLYIPVMETWEGFWKILKNTEGNYDKVNFEITAHEVNENGVIYKDENIEVEALRNIHLGDNGPSFSYKITAGGKTIVYSGDTSADDCYKLYEENGCDYLLTETGHLNPDHACRFLTRENVRVGHLRYIHNGVMIRDEEEKAHELVRSLYSGDYCFCYDGQVEEI